MPKLEVVREVKERMTQFSSLESGDLFRTTREPGIVFIKDTDESSIRLNGPRSGSHERHYHSDLVMEVRGTLTVKDV